MKKLVRVSMVYMIVGLLAGIFYREFTKWNDFTGETQLSVLHTHILILGMFFFLIVLLLEKNFQLSNEKNYKKFYMIYNMGLGITLLMMIVRGSLQVLDYPESAAIAGIAGLGHIIITVGLAYFFQVLFQAVKE
ncbi:hypothetical protein BCR22_03305 [Enterococcus plantarum]|uniref:DUF2871 domain-containing protein n=1 Tax=Enterococcus plantarum TaxID=1077675 RepID=A0A2W4BQG1_9ENTE|nr:DUF2871 domain-containing protein [Enterococcus plantarum]MBO0466707.1 DUF2871 domain-containing protein [Enterococcus plantarum]OEG13284.1 hypothetical protein BCR22_03305 [Enterococcus plantarum]PZL75852.1 DUF2871 domain-containing protein [Enterococcus plantarum]